MKRILKGTLETVAAIAIFVVLMAVYNWAAPWEPDSWSSIQATIGVSIWAIGMIVGALIGAAWLAWRALVAIGRYVRGVGR